MRRSARESIELLHLVFLRALVAKSEDRTLFALKGGCNLRFFFSSVRYSEDIDFDVAVIAPDTLRNKVDRLLRSPLVITPLKAHGITLAETSSPKQTDTTQRWKVGLRVPGTDLLLRTKIEFSRRGSLDGSAFEGLDRDLLRRYGLPSFLTTHYVVQAAIAQKVQALAGRTEPQARDVFDLNLLLARSDATDLQLAPSQRRALPVAIERALSISFNDYRSKVVSFLAPEQIELYRERAAWDAMQDNVVSRLESFQ